MLEALLPETREIIKEAEEAAGMPVRLVPFERYYLSRVSISAIVLSSNVQEVTLAYNARGKSLD